MKIKITSLSEGHHFYCFNENPADLGLDNTYGQKLLVNIDLEKNINQIILRTKIVFVKNLSCDRCLKNFEKEFNTEYIMLYVTDPKDIVGLAEDSVQYISKDKDMIDISKDVIDSILLAIPMKSLCDEDCKGLCLKCGNDNNEKACECNSEIIDPRWEKLKKKFNK